MMDAATAMASQATAFPQEMASLSQQKGFSFIAAKTMTRSLLPSNCLISKLCALTIKSKRADAKPLLSFQTTSWNGFLGVNCASEAEPRKHALKATMLVHSDAKEDENVRQLAKCNQPKISKKERNPKRLSSSASQRVPLDYFQILKYPLVTELAMREILKKNTLVFVVDKHADKKNIKAAAKQMFGVQTKKVNTLVMPDGNKKAYLILTPDYNALEVAKKIKAL